MGFFLHKVCVDDIELHDYFFVAQEINYDVIIGRKAVGGLMLRVVEE